MPEDIEQFNAKPTPESGPSPCNKWAPGSWAAAVAYNAARPEIRCPVIVGRAGSIIQTPEDLRDLCKLPFVPPLTETTETTMSRFPEEQDQQAKETLYIADASLDQFLDLQDCTEGNVVIVWFRGKKRAAWLARAMETSETSVTG